MRCEHEEHVHGRDCPTEEDLPAGDEPVVAATVAAPAGVELRLDSSGLHPLFAVDFRHEDRPPTHALEIAHDGTCGARDAVSAAEVAPSVLVLPEPTDPSEEPRPWRWYQELPPEGTAHTRIELESPLLPGALDRSRFVVGTTGEGNLLAPLLIVDAGGTTTVRGRLHVTGPVVHDPAGALPTDVGPALAVSGTIMADADGSGRRAMFWISNVGSQVVGELEVVVVLPDELRHVLVPSFLAPGAYVEGGVDVPSGVKVVAVTAMGLLLGGRLCHARSLVRAPKVG
ncbi:MAG: hypothetical protein HOV94_24050 [Saccharothrix sp.]|nr:hypothetical protein [Saccharothrix sp.]